MRLSLKRALQILPLILAAFFIASGRGENEKDVLIEDDAAKYQSLIDRNPFFLKPPKPSVAVVKPADNEYLFAGFVVIGDLVRVGIENKNRGKSYLLERGEPTEDGITIKEIHLEEQRVILVANGNDYSLTLSAPSSGTVQPGKPTSPIQPVTAASPSPSASVPFDTAADVTPATAVTSSTTQTADGVKRRTIVVPKRSGS